MDLFSKGLRIGDLFARLPIIQGGMGVGISLSGLAAAVAGEGGIGVISSAGIGGFLGLNQQNFLKITGDALQEEIRKAKEASKGIIGVNIMVALTNFADLVKNSIEAKADIIFAGAGLPLNLPEYIKPGDTTKLVPIISSARAAALICRKWINSFNYVPDAIVVEGPLAGGHIGFKPQQIEDPEFKLENLFKQVMDIIKPFEEEHDKKIPVIPAGGIYSGADIYKFMKMGADGVQMGTRFVVTEECDASDEFKQSYLDATEDDVVIIQSPVGLPGRAIKNSFLKDVSEGNKIPFTCPYHCIRTCDIQKSPYCIAQALLNAKFGKLNDGFAFAGKNVYKTDKILSVKDLIKELNREFKEAVSQD